MKANIIHIALISSVAILPGVPPAHAQFVSGSDGSDGALDFSGLPGGTVVEFDPTTQVPPVDVDGDNVYHFTTITIPTGVTVRLTAPRLNWAPVYWLASGAVDIAGEINLNGGEGHHLDAPPADRRPSIPGPGGFPGGIGAYPAVNSQQPGLGPGGGPAAANFSAWSASHATAGSPGTSGGAPAPTYGTPFLLPLVGGSGGGGARIRNSTNGAGGGAGGGALLIASSASIQIDGAVLARGGNRGVSGSSNAGYGSGGSIRLIAPAFSGSGTVDVSGPSGGGEGRIRVETLQNNFAGTLTGISRTVTLAESTPVLPASGFPRIRIANIAGEAVSSSPTGNFVPPDAVINSTNPVPVVINTGHIPPGTELTVTIFNETVPLVTVSTPALTGTLENGTTTVDVAFPSGFTRGWASASW